MMMMWHDLTIKEVVELLIIKTMTKIESVIGAIRR
jgi:hypothetical protein